MNWLDDKGEGNSSFGTEVLTSAIVHLWSPPLQSQQAQEGTKS